jgi:hypothetical protein
MQSMIVNTISFRQLRAEAVLLLHNGLVRRNIESDTIAVQSRVTLSALGVAVCGFWN